MNRIETRLTFILWCLMVFTFSAAHASAPAEDEGQALLYLKNLSIEQLASLEVTTVSKREERLSDVDAAVYVITSEDIRRSGLTSIPELLRMVPGMQVAHIDSNKWAISARGFNAWFADKLLVLMDGRTVYTPLFSGVYWNIQDTLLDDIDRIEVIRGPGATMWGANAVNGVINIITKKAKDTQGGLLKAGAGNLEQGFGAARYGIKAGDKAWIRAYAKYFNRSPFKESNGHDGNDQWDMSRAGFRMDWEPDLCTTVTIQGDIYDGEAHEELRYFPPGRAEPYGEVSNDLRGGNLITRWQTRDRSGSEISIQFFYDRTSWESSYIEETRDTFDLDFHHSFHLMDSHHIVWGLGYRLTHDHIPETEVFHFEPESRTDDLISGFVQDQISIIADRLDLTIGTKLEHNDYSGFEIQPSARLKYKPNRYHTVWAAVSRAVRTPSRADHDMNFVFNHFKTGPTDNFMVMKGSNDFDPEELIAYEAGIRMVPEKRYSLDISAFYNVYHNLRTTVVRDPEPSFYAWPPPSERIIPVEIVNQYHENSYGIEIAGTIQLMPWWKVSMTYSWLKMRLHTDDDVGDQELVEDNVPCNQYSLRSYMDLPYDLQLDAMMFHVDDLDGLKVPGYTRLDLRLAWNPTKELTVSLKLQNLLDDQHPEYTRHGGMVATEVPRSFYGMATWRF